MAPLVVAVAVDGQRNASVGQAEGAMAVAIARDHLRNAQRHVQIDEVAAEAAIGLVMAAITGVKAPATVTTLHPNLADEATVNIAVVVGTIADEAVAAIAAMAAAAVATVGGATVAAAATGVAAEASTATKAVRPGTTAAVAVTVGAIASVGEDETIGVVTAATEAGVVGIADEVGIE